ncbi:MAG: aminotransferase class IV family protein [Prolixibacteraceae bacterium]|nr:aminotransferase class IV family protein [Prolixibacteraceae bacterium]
MSPLLESLKLKDGIIQNLNYHQDRLNRSMDELFPYAQKIHLAKEIPIPENCKSGIFKIRVLYGQTIEEIEIEPYVFRSVKSLKVVHHESIDYHLKYSDRQILQELFAQRGDCDDIIIVKNGLVTDSFAANLLFFDGEKWFTPKTPLLKGTKRQFLIDNGIVSEKEIREEDIRSYRKVGLINAMIDFEEMSEVNLEQIVF